MSSQLDLYAKVEHLLGIEEATKSLHQTYVEVLYNHEIKSLLDLGCGQGELMGLFEQYGITCEGIDLSERMVKQASKNGYKAEHKSICDVTKSYDAIVSVFDVLNFISWDELEEFLACVHAALNEKGLFVFDVNTLHGFEDVAEGTMVVDEQTRFLSVDAVYEDERLTTTFTLFTQQDEIFFKEQASIAQYYHPLEYFKNLKNFQLINSFYLDLYDEKDKALFVLQKV